MSEKVYGLHAVRALLTRHAERVTGITIAEQRTDPRMAEIQALALKAGKAVKRAPPATFKTLFGDAVHQGVYVDVLPLAVWHEEELVAAIVQQLEAAQLQSTRASRHSCWCSMACRIPTTWAPACARRMPAARWPW